MKWNVGMKIGTGFGLALVILITISAVSYWNTDNLLSTTDWVTHTHLVVESLQNLLSNVKDAETGQRGYVITGDESYLEPYNAAREGLAKEIAEVRSLTKDNVTQQQRIDDLEALIKNKCAVLQETINARKDKTNGFDAALKVIQTGKGKNLMDEIRKVIAEMRENETTLLSQALAGRKCQCSKRKTYRDLWHPRCCRDPGPGRLHDHAKHCSTVAGTNGRRRTDRRWRSECQCHFRSAERRSRRAGESFIRMTQSLRGMAGG